MTEGLDVLLHDVPIGRLVEGGVPFLELDPSWWFARNRPTLGQWFEDYPDQLVFSGPGLMPSFFANMEPEGALARWLARRFDLGTGPLELLAVAGHALPGALGVRRPGRSVAAWRWGLTTHPEAGLLAGVQFKLPMSLDRDDRLVFPAENDESSVLVKWCPRSEYRQIAENERACMAWGQRAGFDVARCWLREAPPLDVPESAPLVLVVERFDRALGPRGMIRIHQEDFCQILGLDPSQKYPQNHHNTLQIPSDALERQRRATSLEGLGRVVRAVLGDAGFVEFLRRVVFVIAAGNGDAHLKNWSVVYPDRRNPRWSPMYDQVSTIAWKDATLALPLYGADSFAKIHRQELLRLATEVGAMRADDADRLLDQTLAALASAWTDGDPTALWPSHHRELLVHHWRSTVPLLRESGFSLAP